MNDSQFKKWCNTQSCGEKPDCKTCKVSYVRAYKDFNDDEGAKVKSILIIIVGCVLLFLIIVGGAMWGLPTYDVYNKKMQGRAILAHAQSSREVAVAEAKAKMESALLLAEADTLRAHGVARSNEIIGNSLKENEAYLRYLWIDELGKTKNQIIYVPTEANLPILEASRNK